MTHELPGLRLIRALCTVDDREVLLVLPVGLESRAPGDMVGVWARDPGLAKIGKEILQALFSTG